MDTAFKVGDVLIARPQAAAQGFKPWERYEVRRIDQRHTPFGNFVTYWLADAGAPELTLLRGAVNAHFVFDTAPAPPKDLEKAGKCA